MKKMIISIVSIFLPFNIVFAQTPQQKVDSLKRVEIQAAKAQQRAEAALRQEMTDANYQAAKAAKERHAEVSSELEAAIRVLEEEAKEAARKAKIEEDKRVAALYEKRFKAFEVAGIDAETKKLILEQLRKDSNWDIVDVKVKTYVESPSKSNDGWNYAYGDGPLNTYSADVIIIDSDGREWTIYSAASYDNSASAKARQKAKPIQKALEYRKDPVKLYEAIQYKAQREAKAKYEKSFMQYYLKLTGVSLKEFPYECWQKIEVYQIDVPDDSRYYYEVGRDERSNYFFLPLDVKPGTYFYFKCNGEFFGQIAPLFARKWGMFFSFASRKKGKDGKFLFFESADKENIDDISDFVFIESVDRENADIINKFDLEPVPRKLLKTFKREDFN